MVCVASLTSISVEVQGSLRVEEMLLNTEMIPPIAYLMIM